MKELLAYISGLVSLAGYLFCFAIFGSIAIVAYHFYPPATATVLSLIAIGWVMEFFKQKNAIKTAKSLSHSPPSSGGLLLSDTPRNLPASDC